MPDLSNYGSSPSVTRDFNEFSVPNITSHVTGPSPVAASQMAMTRENSQEPETDDTELVSAPMRSLFEVTKLRNLRSNLQSSPRSKTDFIQTDFISRGELPLEQAEQLFNIYNHTMNHFLWGGVALKHKDLASVRHSSSLLSAAILTVASLHVTDNDDNFDICYNEFISIVSSSTLDRYHTLDEIRALCIGAFWLSDLSWKLSGHAVRIATEMNCHQSVQKMLRGKSDQYERAQVWYLLYICDHHFSIAYGRPPVIHEDPAVQLSDRFLEFPNIGPADIRLICQVELFRILTKAYHEFGSVVEQDLLESEFPQLRGFNVDIEQWRIDWEPRLADSPVVATYPSKGVVLHYHFAKFQLNSLALRAITSSTPLSMNRKEAANLAISSAMATLNFVLEEPDIRNAIVGVPLFTHTMIAFSAVFLLKVAWKWNVGNGLNIDAHHVQDLVQNIINLMGSAKASEKHLTYHIAKGLERMLERLRHWEAGQQLVMVGSGGTLGVEALQRDGMFDALDTYGFGFDGTWNEFSTPLDLFPTPYLPG